MAASLMAACTTLPKAAMETAPPTQAQIASVNQGKDFNFDTKTKTVALPAGWHLIPFTDFLGEYGGKAFSATESWDEAPHHLVWASEYSTVPTKEPNEPEYHWKIEDSANHISEFSQTYKSMKRAFFVVKYGQGWDVCAAVTNGQTDAIWYIRSHSLEILGKPASLPVEKAG